MNSDSEIVSQNKNQAGMTDKVHQWRICPSGKHFVRTHKEHIQPNKSHPDGMIVTRHEHCANNPSGKDELLEAEIQHITKTYFADLSGPPTAGKLTKVFPKADDYDLEIRGWVQYWNDIFHPDELLDPNLIKALIATESSFKLKQKKASNAHGLMQITDDTFTYLTGAKNELKDYLLRVTKKELLDPSTNICAGVRWLFRKKETASNKLKREATWDEAIEDYKDYLNKILKGKKYNKKPMNDLHAFYKILQEK